MGWRAEWKWTVYYKQAPPDACTLLHSQDQVPCAYSSTRPLVLSFIRLLVLSFSRPLVLLFIRPLVLSFIRPLTHSHALSFIRPLTHSPRSLTHSHIISFILPLARSSIRPPAHSFTHKENSPKGQELRQVGADETEGGRCVFQGALRDGQNNRGRLRSLLIALGPWRVLQKKEWDFFNHLELGCFVCFLFCKRERKRWV